MGSGRSQRLGSRLGAGLLRWRRIGRLDSWQRVVILLILVFFFVRFEFFVLVVFGLFLIFRHLHRLAGGNQRALPG